MNNLDKIKEFVELSKDRTFLPWSLEAVEHIKWLLSRVKELEKEVAMWKGIAGEMD